MQAYVGELRALGAFSCALSQALRFVRERVQSLTVAPESPRPGHLYASHLSQAGYAGRPHLFIVGLEEGRVFSSSTEPAQRIVIKPRRAPDMAGHDVNEIEHLDDTVNVQANRAGDIGHKTATTNAVSVS